MGFQPFLVASFSSGISTYLKPWLQTDESLTEMQDCYTYRGVIQKRYGYGLYDTFPEGIGILHLGTGDGVDTSFSGTLPYTPVGKRSLRIAHTQGGTLIDDGVDDGAGNITGTNIAAGSTINYATGAITINFTAAPDNATGIRVDFGVRIATGDGVTTVFNVNLNTIIPGLPIKKRSLYIENTFTAQFTPPNDDVPAANGQTGSLVNVPNGVTAGNITYDSGAITTLTFAVAPPAAATDQDIWARWEFPAAANPIKGIKYFWTSDSTQDTLIFNNNQMAIFDAPKFKLTNVTGDDYFTTTDKSFFSVANYLGKAFILNAADRLTCWDGEFLFQPVVSFTSSTPTVNELTTGLHVILYKNRLLVLRPTESNVVRPQRVRFSALNNPFNWASDVQGAGGFVDAPTAEWIVSWEFIRDELIVHFQTSTWRLRYTGIDVNPYRWEKINQTRRVSGPYSAVGYQNFDTVFGPTGLLRCDGVNIERYDDKIIDFSEQEVDQENGEIINGYRFDQRNQQLLCYRSQTIIQDLDYCDKWLVWNFLENSFSIFNIPSTTFGGYFTRQDLTWDDFSVANGLVHPGSNPATDIQWGDFQAQTWLSYFAQGNAEIPVFGTETGKVMQLFPAYSTDNGAVTGFSFTTKQFNPFVSKNQRVQLGFIDFYFDRPDDTETSDPDYNLTVEIYIDEYDTPVITQILNPSEDNWSKKRVYANVTAQFVWFKIYLSDEQLEVDDEGIPNSSVATKGFILNGYILYMAPAGRLIG